MSIGSEVGKGSKYLSNIAGKRNDITNKINDVRNKIMIPKPLLESPQENINFA
jgi:hypothetical protein